MTIVPELKASAEQQFGDQRRRFQVLDILNDPLPKADLWLCRDVLFHLPKEDILRILRRFAVSDIPLILTSTYAFQRENTNVAVGGFRRINLELPPFNLPRASRYVDDFIVPWPPRALGLWSREQIAGALF